MNTLGETRIALSIRQPWAWLIVNGHKDIENRTWYTDVRGDFLVHSAKTFDEDGYHWVQNEFGIQMPNIPDFDRGGIVGVVELVDCVKVHVSPWFTGPYGFVLSKPRLLQFVQARGRLGFFQVNV